MSKKLQETVLELEESEDIYRLIVETCREGIWVIDGQDRTTFVNQRMADMLGAAPRELVGKTPVDSIAEEQRAEAAKAMAQLREGTPGQFEFTLIQRDGAQVYVIISASPLTDEEGRFLGTLGLVTDITQRKRAERRLEVDYAVASVIAEAPGVEAGLTRILGNIGRGLGWESAGFWALTEDGTALQLKYLWHSEGAGLAEFEDLSRELRFAPGKGLIGQVWAEDEPSWVSGIGERIGHPDHPRAEAAVAAGLNSAFAFPVTVGNRVLGVMEFLTVRSQEPDLELIQTMGAIGAQIGQFIERTAAEERLRQSEARLGEAQRIARMGSWDWDLVRGDVVWSNELLRLFGLEPGEFAGTYEGYLELVHPEDRATVEANVKKASETAAPISFDTRVIRSDGAMRVLHTDLEVDVDADGRAVRMVGTAQDFTELVEANERLRISEERFRRLFESAGVGIAMVDLEGKLSAANPAFAKMLGYEAGELLGLPVDSVTHEDDRASTAKHLESLFSGARDDVRAEKRYLHKDGRIVWAELSVSVIRDADGKPAYTVAIVSDITDRKELQEQFIQAQKMEAVGRVAGGIAHDFNNLLLAINGYSELALSSLDEADEARDWVSNIKSAAERAAKLTRELLAFSRKEVLRPVVTDINEVIGDADSLLRTVLGADNELSLALDPGLGRATLDPARLEQAVMNLAINAKDAMPDGGRLAISTSNLTVEDALPAQADAIEPGSYVVLTVADTGTGMDEATRQEIFEPYFTTKERGRGTGLGLATVFGFVTQSGGRIRLTSAPGNGTTFELFFPRVFDAQPTNGSQVRSEGEAAGTVLLVEDEEMVRKLLSEVLSKRGYHVVEACTGLEAVEFADHYDGKVDVLVTDLVMPEMGGRAAAEHIVRNHPEAAVIFMSGYTNELSELDGGIPFLQKPFAPAELVAVIETALGGAG